VGHDNAHQRDNESDVGCVEAVEDVHHVPAHKERSAERRRSTSESGHELLEHVSTMNRASDLSPYVRTLRPPGAAASGQCVF
jgi:hypothetical protein